MRLWLITALIVLLIIGGVAYQAFRVPSVSDIPVAEAIFTYDLLIRNVVILDGSGAARQYGSIGILGDRITAIGPSVAGWSRRVIDGKGLYAAPGFIDLGPLAQPNSRKLLMGVTTQVVTSVDPSPWRTARLNTNVAWLVDQEELSRQVTGGATAAITRPQLGELGERMAASLKQGASGGYLSASSSAEKLMRSEATLWSVFADQGAKLFWQTPIGDPNVTDAVTGLLARSTVQKVPVHLSGVNLSHQSSWGRVYDIINLIDRAQSSVTADLVPYFENPQVAERDLLVFVSHPSIAIASGSELQHPAPSGAFPRLMQRFVNQEPILSIEEAVAKSTQLPAAVLGLADRGLLRAGYSADIVLFDGSTIQAPADAGDQPASPQGVHTVIINGKIAAEGGRETAEKAGRLLSRSAQADRKAKE